MPESLKLSHLGPGLITGAADDDPSGIATYSQAGAQFGFNMLWTVVLTFPLMAGIQMISARLGCITGRGLAANIKDQFPRPLLYVIVSLLLIANTINIAADIAAMGEALRLLVGGSAHVYSLTFGLLCVVLQVFLNYETYVGYLKWLTLALLAYVAVIFSVHVPWGEALQRLVWPHIQADHDTITMIVAVFGTTISPYLFFWQAAQEVEEMRNQRSKNGQAEFTPHDHASAARHLRRIKWDTYIGMGFSNLIAFFIILSTAATLHLAGIRDIQTSAQAAEVLRPLAGDMAFLMFAGGIIGTGLLAIPVLGGSAAFATAEVFGWKAGLDLKPSEGRGFYGIIAFATLGGVLLNFTPMDPMRELFWSAVINGVIAVPIMVVMMILGSREAVMGPFTVHTPLKRLGWLATAAMAAAVIGMFATL